MFLLFSSWVMRDINNIPKCQIRILSGRFVQIAGMINQWKELINPVAAKKKKKMVSFQFAPGSFVPLIYLTGYLPSINLNRTANALNCKKQIRGDRLSNPRCSCRMFISSTPKKGRSEQMSNMMHAFCAYLLSMSHSGLITNKTVTNKGRGPNIIVLRSIVTFGRGN